METQSTFKFGFKSRKVQKEEEKLKYDFPYVEVIPSKKKGSVTKFRLLNGAARLLELSPEEDNKISYFQVELDDFFYLANTTKMESNPATCKVNKDNSFNSKNLHKRICEDFSLNLKETLYFKPEIVEVEGAETLTTVVLKAIQEEEGEEVTSNNENTSDEPKFEPINADSEIPTM